MSKLHLTLRAARHLHLAAQGLLNRPRRLARAADILPAIQQMSLLQIDTINVVARSPYLVLFSRLGAYLPAWLDEALSRGELMEYWAHEACFLPRSDSASLASTMDSSLVGAELAQPGQVSASGAPTCRPHPPSQFFILNS